MWSLLLLLVSMARAVEGEPPTDSVSTGTKTLADHFTALAGDDAPERLYAARTVRAELRHHLTVQARAQPGSLADLEARSVLVELAARVPGACRSGLRFENSAMLCTEMLADLEVLPMLPEVEAARPLVKGRCAIKRYEAALVRLQAVVSQGRSTP